MLWSGCLHNKIALAFPLSHFSRPEYFTRFKLPCCLRCVLGSIFTPLSTTQDTLCHAFDVQHGL